VPSLYIFETLKYVIKNFKAFKNKIVEHEHNTRRKNILKPMQSKLKVSQKGIHFMGPKLFNKIPIELRDLSKKKSMKSLSIEKKYYSVKEFLYDDSTLKKIRFYM